MKTAIHGICFDLFNTLVNVAEVPLETGAFTADILGVDRDKWRDACFGPEHEICRPVEAFDNIHRIAHSIDATISHDTIMRATVARQRRFDHALLNIELNVLKNLQILRESGLKLALVSNASSSEVAAWPDSPLAVHFDAVIFSCECGSQKPEAEIYMHASKALGISPQECLFVGDGGSNEHHGAQLVGMSPVLLSRHLGEKEHRQRREHNAGVLTAEMRNLDELCAYVRRHNPGKITEPE